MNHHNFMERIRNARRCQPEIKSLASAMAAMQTEEYEKMIKELIAGGEDTALGILMNVCAVNRIRLDPDLLAQTIMVIEPIIDLGPLYRFQDQSAIPALLMAADNDEISSERQAYAVLIAAEMCVFHGADRQPVRRTAQVLEQTISFSPPISILLSNALALLDAEKSAELVDNMMSQDDILKLLPKERPPVIIGDGQTVRRPVPKIGRNAPCHCGSGKKYKKCCAQKDQDLIRDASSYEGLTRTQISTSPKLVEDTGMIQTMRAYELKKLKLSTLNDKQLYAAYRRADLFGLGDLSFSILQELENRSAKSQFGQFDPGHYIDLIHSALDRGKIDLAIRIHEHAASLEKPLDFDTIPLVLALYQTGMLDKLEERLKDEITNGGYIVDPLLIRLGYLLEKTHPALAISFCRAFIAGNPDQDLDNQELLNTIRKARARLDLEVYDDPLEDYMEWLEQKFLDTMEDKAESKALIDLNEKLEAARDRIQDSQRALRQKEEQLQQVAKELERHKNRPTAVPPKDRVSKSGSGPDEKEVITRLRRQVDNLKAEIGSQQQIRRELRHELQSEKEKNLKSKPAVTSVTSPEDDSADSVEPPAVKKILIPDFTSAFQKAGEILPKKIFAKALKTAVEFAAGDASIFRNSKSIKVLPDVYRVRIGRDYRLMLLWRPEETLRVLDCIPRQGLEAWIQRHAAAKSK